MNQIAKVLTMTADLANLTFTYNAHAHIYEDDEKPPGHKHLNMAGARSKEPPHPVVLAEIEAMLDHLEDQYGWRLLQHGFATTTDEHDAYKEQRAAGTLFDVRAVQLALADIPLMITYTVPAHFDDCRIYREHKPYQLAERLKDYRQQRIQDACVSGRIETGDFIMAMLLLSFPLTVTGEYQGPNPTFACCSLMERVKFVPGYSKSEYTAFHIQGAVAHNLFYQQP